VLGQLVDNLNTARSGLAGAGTQTAGLAFGGDTPGPPSSAATEEYDGSTWTLQEVYQHCKTQLGGFGIQTAALAFGGNPPANGTYRNRRI
jgi:hypothetical protein